MAFPTSYKKPNSLDFEHKLWCMEVNKPEFPSNADLERVGRIMGGDQSNVDYDLATSVYYKGSANAISNGNKSVWEGITKAANEWCARFQNPHRDPLASDEIRELKEQVQWLMQKVKDLEFPGR